MITVTSIVSYSALGGSAYNSAHNPASSGMVLVFSCTSYGAPTYGGIAMALVDSVTVGTYTFGVYAIKTTAGSYTLSIASQPDYQAVFVSEASAILASWKASAKTLAVSPGNVGICCDFLWSSGSDTGGYNTTPPTGYSEVADSKSIGSGGDWGKGIENSYRVNPPSETLACTNSASSFAQIAVQLIPEQVGGASVSVMNEIGVAI